MVMNEKKLNSKRAIVYKILSECFYIPDVNIITYIEKLNESLCELYPQIGKYIPTTISDIADLTVDYAKLFVGPYSILAPPYGSIYLGNNGELMDSTTIEVLQQYKDGGLSISDNAIPDHIAIELEYMYFLIYKEIDSDNETTSIFIEKQKDFIQANLGLWVTDFTDNIIEHASTDYYKDLAVFTNEFIRAELLFLSR